MNNQIFFLIILTIVLIYLLPEKKNCDKNSESSLDIINKYLGQKCNENFNTMGFGMNMGNNMDFKQEQYKKTKLNKALENSLVPDFEPNSLNINPDINEYGYATNSNNINKKSYLDPTYSNIYANTIEYNLSHPYQTRYCK